MKYKKVNLLFSGKYSLISDCLEVNDSLRLSSLSENRENLEIRDLKIFVFYFQYQHDQHYFLS